MVLFIIDQLPYNKIELIFQRQSKYKVPDYMVDFSPVRPLSPARKRSLMQSNFIVFLIHHVIGSHLFTEKMAEQIVSFQIKG